MLKYKNVFKFFLHRQDTENSMVKKSMQDEDAELKRIIEQFNVKVIVIGADYAKMKNVYDKVKNHLTTNNKGNVELI